MVKSEARTGNRGKPALPTPSSVAAPLRLVVVEDSQDDYDLLCARLHREGFAPVASRVETGEALEQALAAGPVDAVISDHKLPQFSSLAALAIVRARDADLPFIIVSGAIGEESAVAAMRAGANDYLLKDRLTRLAPALRTALQAAAERRAHREADASLVASEARYRAITANLPGMVFQLHFHDDALVFDYASDGALALLGRTPAALCATPHALAEWFAPAEVEALVRLFHAGDVLDAGIHWHGAMRAAPGAPPKWVQVDASALRLPDGTVQWNGIARDVSHRERADEALRASRAEAMALASHLNGVREEEREFLAREIHDDVGSSLTAVKFGLASLRGAPGAAPDLVARTRDIEGIVDGVIHATSRLVHDLRPGIIDEGIVPALEWLVRSFEQRVAIPCRLFASPADLELDRERGIAVFRVCQEALNNAAKYSGATRIDVRLEVAAGSVALEVRDNGRGIAAEELTKSTAWGLRGMRERAASLGGELDVAGTSGTGATVTLLLPLPHAGASPWTEEAGP